MVQAANNARIMVEMKVRVLTDAIVGAGFYLTTGDEVELSALGEFAEAMLRDGDIEFVEPAQAVVEAKSRLNNAWLF